MLGYIFVNGPYWLKNIFYGDGFQSSIVVFEHIVESENCSFTDIFDVQSTSRPNHDLLLRRWPALTSVFTYSIFNCYEGII